MSMDDNNDQGGINASQLKLEIGGGTIGAGLGSLLASPTKLGRDMESESP